MPSRSLAPDKMAFRKLLVAEAKVKVARLGAALSQVEEELLLASADSDSDQCSETRSPASVPVLSPSHASSPASPPPAATPSGAAPALASDVMKKWLHFVREVVLCQAEPKPIGMGKYPVRLRLNVDQVPMFLESFQRITYVEAGAESACISGPSGAHCIHIVLRWLDFLFVGCVRLAGCCMTVCAGGPRLASFCTHACVKDWMEMQGLIFLCVGEFLRRRG